MNRKFKLTVILLFIFLAAVINTFAVEKSKEYHESWPVNSVESLEINNKFGDIKVVNDRVDLVTIDVVITVEAGNEINAEELLSLIDVDFNKTGSTVRAVTDISSDFESRQKFSINYEINIPSDKNLKIFNKYGDTFVNILNANGFFDISYGNFTANELNAPTLQKTEINLGYCKSDIGSANDISLTIQYSNINLGQIGDLTLNSKYTVISLGKADAVTAESRYDTFNFEDIESLSVNSKYTNYKVDKLLNRLEIESSYGGVNINKVDPEFEFIKIYSSYGHIALGLDDANYSLDAACKYCGISFPKSRFAGNSAKEDHTMEVNGRVGDQEGGEVDIESRYGNIKMD
jgi:hypothetical protein